MRAIIRTLLPPEKWEWCLMPDTRWSQSSLVDAIVIISTCVLTCVPQNKAYESCSGFAVEGGRGLEVSAHGFLLAYRVFPGGGQGNDEPQQPCRLSQQNGRFFGEGFVVVGFAFGMELVGLKTTVELVESC